MILDYYGGAALTPELWEDLCDSCYSIRYPEKWHKMPSAYLGDCGIEGFTNDGIVYQCYCPEQPYSNQELYEHQRDKLTTDVQKIVSDTNIARLQSVLGSVKIKEWHLVVPEYKDIRILQHANKKKQEILNIVHSDPAKYSHIDASFTISVMQDKNFIEEMSKTIRSRNNKLSLRIKDVGDEEVDYSSCAVEKVDNIRRKFQAIQPAMSLELLNKMVSTYIKYYLQGVEVLNDLKLNLPSAYAELHNLLNSYKDDVEIETALNADSSLNKELFTKITNGFMDELNKLEIFDMATVRKLKNEIIAGWLADCSMEFVV